MQVQPKQVFDAAKASELLLHLSASLNLGTDVHRLEPAVNRLALQGADTVADFRELPGTFADDKFSDSLGFPLIKAQRNASANLCAHSIPS
jgi:hypothetical protein